MLRLEFRASKFKIDKKLFVEKMKAAIIKDIYKPAYKKFIEAALKLTPVDTGMSAGAFMLLSKMFKMPFPALKRTHSKYAGQPIRRFRRYYDPGRPGNREFKTPLLGSQLTIGSKGVNSAGTPKEIMEWNGNVLTAKFYTGIAHFEAGFEEWGNIAAGIEAFRAEVRRRLSKRRSIHGCWLYAKIEATRDNIRESPYAPVPWQEATEKIDNT